MRIRERRQKTSAMRCTSRPFSSFAMAFARTHAALMAYSSAPMSTKRPSSACFRSSFAW
jgi:hypothetical protein